jgi:hypothetical protein
MKILLPVCLAAAVIISCEQGEGGLQGAGEDARFGNEEAGQPLLTGISIASPPQTIYYAIGQDFDPGGLVVEGEFDDGSSRALDEGEYRLTVIPPDMTVSGPKEVEVAAGEFTAKTAVIVHNSDSVLDSISVKAVGGAVHRLGESFRPASLNVTGTFRDKKGNASEKNLSVFSVQGYDGGKRGEQTVTVSVNGKKGTAPVMVRVPEDAAVVSAYTVGTNLNETVVLMDGSRRVWGHNTVFIKGQSLALSNVKLTITVRVDGVNYTLSSWDGIEPDEINLDTSNAGAQTLTVNLDEKTIPVDVYVADMEPEAYFDYGFWRHETMTQPDGYHTVPGNKVVLSPVRALIGYDRDNKDIGATYEWTVTPVDGAGDIPYSANKEFCSLTPKTTGKWDVTVTVTGRNFIDGETVTKTASTTVVCDPAKTINYTGGKEYKHFSPGQFTEGGTGSGWSLGTIGGYWIKSRTHKEVYEINGNAFGDWVEPGMVWFQEDLNGNNEPDEVWYEAHGAPSTANTPITRRYSVTFFKADDTSSPSQNTYGQIIRDIYWADCKGRAGKIHGGWPYKYGAPNYDGAKVTYTCTLFSDDDRINVKGVGDFKLPANVPFVDYYPPEKFPISSAVAADGSPVKLTNVRFVKVHTAVFQIGDSSFGEISTEIDQNKADWRG